MTYIIGDDYQGISIFTGIPEDKVKTYINNMKENGLVPPGILINVGKMKSLMSTDNLIDFWLAVLVADGRMECTEDEKFYKPENITLST